MDIEHFISEVFTRPVLWDQKNKSYHNRILVEKQLMSVATEMKVSREDLKKKWKYLRDQFRVELRKIPKPKSGDAGDTILQNYTSWPYFQSLMFLKDQMQYKKLSGNLKPTKAKGDKEGVDVDFEEEQNEERMDDSFESYSEVPIKKKKNTLNRDDQLLEIETRKLKLLEEKKSAKKAEVDEDEAFFLTLLPHIRKFDTKDKFLWRMEVQNLTYKYLYGRTESTPQMLNESSRYAAISSPISCSSDRDNLYSEDHSTSYLFHPNASSSFHKSQTQTQYAPSTSTFHQSQIENVPSTSSSVHLQIPFTETYK